MEMLAETPLWVARRPLTVAEYARMGEVGILSQSDRVELIEGELIAMSPIGSNHAGTVNAFTSVLVRQVGDRGVVAVQNPVRPDNYSEPQPDFAVLKPRADFYRGATPQPEDVLLLIEIADSSLRYDRDVKLRLYARHGIPEVWIVDLTAKEVEICCNPSAGLYTSIKRVGRDGILEPGLLPGVVLSVAMLIGD